PYDRWLNPWAYLSPDMLEAYIAYVGRRNYEFTAHGEVPIAAETIVIAGEESSDDETVVGGGGGGSGGGGQASVDILSIKINLVCPPGNPLVTINDNPIESTNSGGAQILLDKYTSMLFSQIASRASGKNISFKPDTLLQANPLDNGGYKISVNKPVSINIPGPFNVNVNSVTFNSNGLVASAEASFLGIKGPPSSKVKSEINKALEVAFGKGEGLTGDTVKGLLNKITNTKAGVCIKATVGPVTR